MMVAAAGLLGLVVGSFLNVVVYRVPRRQSLVSPGSRCSSCGARIRAYDNVPLLSYAWLGGRCRNCDARIPARYPAIEALTAVLFAAAAYGIPPGVDLFRAFVLVAALLALAAIDLEHGLLPNVIVLPVGLLGLVLAVGDAAGGWWMYPLSALAVGGGLFALAASYPGGMGMGDVKMGAMLGALLGPYAALAVFVAALLGTVFAIVLVVFRKVGRRHPLPFGTFMAAGGVTGLLFGPELWGAYLGIAGNF